MVNVSEFLKELRFDGEYMRTTNSLVAHFAWAYGAMVEEQMSDGWKEAVFIPYSTEVVRGDWRWRPYPYDLTGMF